MEIERLLKQKPDIDKTKAPLAEEDLPSFATSDSKKLRPVWIAGVINYLVMVIVVSAISFSVPKEDFRAGGWAKEFVDKVGKVIPAIKKHELLRQKGDRTTITPFVFACTYIWLFISNFCIAVIIKKPFSKRRSIESYRRYIWARGVGFLGLIYIIYLIWESPHARFNLSDTGSVFLHNLFNHIFILYFFFFLINSKELCFHLKSDLAGGSHE